MKCLKKAIHPGSNKSNLNNILRKINYIQSNFLKFIFSLLRKIINLSRWKRLCILIFIDGFLIYFSVFFSFLITEINHVNYTWIFFLSLIFAIPFFIISRGYKGLTKYIGSQELYSLSLRNLSVLFIIYVTGLFFQFKTPPINLWIILYLLLISNKLKSY